MPDSETPFLIFNFCDSNSQPQCISFANPIDIVSAANVNDVLPALQRVQDAVNNGYYAAGYLSYEAAQAFDRAFQVHQTPVMPLVWFGIFDKVSPIPTSCQGNHNECLWNWHIDTNRIDYSHKIFAIQEAIRDGLTYQVNHTIRLNSQFNIGSDDYALYQQLRSAQQSDYCAYMNMGRHRVLSASPELFFRLNGDQIITKPMKGTIPRGLSAKEDMMQREELKCSEKNRAENVMIVDLLRNDLGRIAETGTVKVTKLFEIEKYPTLYQLTSTIEAKCHPKTALADIFTALFPCGSITGAPKISTMRLISQLETTPREIYCGAIGYITPHQTEAVFNVAIRTMWIDTQTGKAQYGIGGGITIDSDAEDEYREAISKARILDTAFLTSFNPPLVRGEINPTRIPSLCKGITPPLVHPLAKGREIADTWGTEFSLLETMRLENGEYWLLERHLKRLQSSAGYFDIAMSIDNVKQTLKRLSEEYPAECRRVRLLVSQSGRVYIESFPLILNDNVMQVGLANVPICRNNRFIYHKTTYRSIYDIHKENRAELFDILLWNDQNELTEFTIGNLVVEIDGKKYTPPVKCGVLPGTFREELLDAGDIEERVITKGDLQSVSAIWLINSVRGWVRVELRKI